jgi:DNA helicase HerA-like ATPase
MPEKLTFLGRVDYRNDRRIFGIKQQDRFSHIYVIEKTGTGKSTLLENMALQDLENGNGFALIDPHGDLAARLASHVPESRRDDLIYLNAADPHLEWGYNPLRHVPPEYIALAASGCQSARKFCRPNNRLTPHPPLQWTGPATERA